MTIAAGSRVLIVGAGSGIAEPLIYRLAERGCHLILAGRRKEDLESIVSDITIRFDVEASVEVFDALQFEQHETFLQRCLSRWDEGLDVVVLCYGAMHDQAAAQQDFALARRMIDVNFTSAASLLERLADYFEQRGRGVLAAISSVAGDRGRQSNYLYGSSKAGLNAYLQGLRNRLHHAGVRLLTIKPGFVDTPMTRGKLDPNSRLVAKPDRVASDIMRALGRKDVLYTPWIWWYIMFVIRSIPEWLFKRLKM